MNDRVPTATGNDARNKVFREESLRRHRAASRRESIPLMIRSSTLVALWAVVVLLAVAAAGFVLLLRAQLEDGGERGARPEAAAAPVTTVDVRHLPVLASPSRTEGAL